MFGPFFGMLCACVCEVCVRRTSSLRSWPAQKTPSPAARMTMARNAGSAARDATAACTAPSIASDSAFLQRKPEAAS